MNPHPSAHPTDRTLHAYGLGKLDDASAESVNSHLGGCPDCRQRVAALTSDSFLGRLRDAQARLESLHPAVSATEGLSPLDRGPAAAPPPASALPPGLADLRDYEILRELGQGGMGVVFLAQNTLMGRMEVLKVVSDHLLNRRGVLDRFLTEIRNAARLHHPNIVAAYTAIRLGESFVLSMEYVEGLDLSRLVKARGPLPVANACGYIHQAALGLQHAHERGMVHRDIKPSNLMLAREGNRAIIKVLDFGLAKVQSEGAVDGGLTHEGQMLGTPDFIAPEQISDARRADIRADIYSLGCTLYYLLTARPPFQGDSLYDILQAHHSMDAAPLNLVRPDVPVEVAAIVAKMMAKETGRRFQEPKEVAQALKPFFKAGIAVPVGEKPDVSQVGRTIADQGTPRAVATSARPMDSPRPTTVRKPAEKAQPEPSWDGLIDLRETDPLHDSFLDSPGQTRTPLAKIPHPRDWATSFTVLRGRVPGSWWMIAGVFSLGFAIALAAVVLRVKTRDGVIVLENLPEEAEVYVDGGEVKVYWPDGGVPAEISVPPGPHGVQVKAPGFTAFGEDVTVEAGGRRGLRVHLERAAVERSTGKGRDVLDRLNPPPSFTPTDRARFTEVAGRWEVDRNELVQSDLTKWYSSLMFGDERWTDYDFTVDAMRTGGQNSFSLFFRGMDRGHGFEYRVAGEGNKICRVEHNESFHATSLGEAFAARLENGRWYTARVHVRGGHFACSLYDCEAAREVGRLEVEAGRHPRGRVGLGTFLSSYRFKNIRVTDPDGRLLWQGPPAVEPVKLAHVWGGPS